MDEDSNANDSNSSAKRSKLDNDIVTENETSTSNLADVEMTESSPSSDTVPNASKSDNNKSNETPVEDSGYAENEKKDDQEESSQDAETKTNNCDEPGTSSRIRRPNKRNRAGFKRRNYRPRVISSSEDSDDNINPGTVFPTNSDSDSDSEENDDASSSSLSSFDFPPLFVGETSTSVDSQSVSSNRSNQSPASDYIEFILEKMKPIYNWNLVQEIMYREHGLSNNGRSSVFGRTPIAFQNRFCGARHNIEKMMLLHLLEEHRGCVNSLHFNKRGNLLVSGSDDLKIILWDWASNKVAFSFNSGHYANVFQTKFIELNSGINIVSSGRDGQVRHATILPSGSKKVISTVLLKHTGPVHKIAPNPNNPYEILSAGEDGHVVRCDLRERPIERVVTVKEHKRKVALYSIAHNPLEQEFCVCGRDKYVRVYDKRNTKKPVYKLCPIHLDETEGHASHITCAVYNNTGTEIVASYSDEYIYLFSLKKYSTGQYEHSYAGHNNNKTIKGVNFFGMNSEYVVSGSDCGNMFFWSKESESIINWIKGDCTGVVNCLEPHPSFPILATSGLDNDVKIWVPFKNEYPPELTGLTKCVKKNMKRTVIPDNDLLDDGTFFFFVRQCLRNRRLAINEDSCPNVQDLVSSSSGEEDGTSQDGGNIYALPCTPQ